jgi:hypothetical protein
MIVEIIIENMIEMIEEVIIENIKKINTIKNKRKIIVQVLKKNNRKRAKKY